MTAVGKSSSVTPVPKALSDAYRRAVDDHSILSICDTNGVITYANDLFCQALGYELDELIGRPFSDINVPTEGSTSAQVIAQTINSGQSWTGQVCNRSKDETLRWFELIVVPMYDDHGAVVAHLNVRKDITRRRQAEQNLERSEQFLLDVSELAQVGGWSLDLRTGALFWSAQTKRIHDVPEDYEPSLETAISFYAPEARSAVTHAVETAINTGGSWDIELPLITATGRSIWVRAQGSAIEEGGQVVGLMGAFQDITERKLAEDLLRDEVSNRHSAEQLLRDVLETLPDAVAAYDEADKLIVCNSAYLETYAASAEAITPGASFESIIRFGLERGQYAEAGTLPHEQQAWLEKRLADHHNPPEHLTQRLRDGRWLQVREHRSQTGTTVGVRTDITTLKRAEAELRRYAEIDPLTGLLNRRQFAAQLGELLEELNEGGHTGAAICLFDLDHFKPINDSYGHDVGDEVLCEVASRLNSVLGPGDFAARLGGDEFVFVLVNRATREAFDDVIIALFKAMRIPTMTSVGNVQAGVSLGAVQFGREGHSPQELMKFADLAQYTAKETGRGRWHWFSEEDAQRQKDQTELARALAATLAAEPAVARKQISVALQPIAGLQDGASLGYSADVSWKRGDEVIGADGLLAIAQRRGQTPRLGRLVMETAIEAIGEAAERGAKTGQLWLTMGADHLKIKGLVEDLELVRQTNDLAPESITIAVAESAFSARSSSAIEHTFLDLKSLGYRLALDEYGTGGTSAVTLDRLGIKCVRLASSLTANLAEDSSKHALVRSVTQSVKALDIDVVANKVTTPHQAAVLGEFGIDAIQGSLVSDPIALEDLHAHLAEAARRDLSNLLSQDGRNDDQAPARTIRGAA